MKGKRLSAALAAVFALMVVGAGTAAATGALSSHHNDKSIDRAVSAALRDKCVPG